MSKSLYTKYAHLEALALDEIDLDTVDMVVVRTDDTNNHHVNTIIKVSASDMMVPNGQGYLASHKMFISYIKMICERDNTSGTVEEIVKWRDVDGTWHIHTGPLERHAKLGDRVRLTRNSQKVHKENLGEGHLVKIYNIRRRQLAQVAFKHETLTLELHELRYVDGPDVPVIP